MNTTNQNAQNSFTVSPCYHAITLSSPKLYLKRTYGATSKFVTVLENNCWRVDHQKVNANLKLIMVWDVGTDLAGLAARVFKASMNFMN